MSEEEDNKFWEEFTKNVKKNKTPKIKVEHPAPKITIKESEPNPDIGFEFKYSSSETDAKTAKKFRKNEFPIEATLDLHGMTENKAFDAVRRFILGSYQKSLRCILIITGKGLHQSDSEDIFAPRAVLKTSVPTWLDGEELRPLILSYNHPNVKLGGSGALYILLRRKIT